MVRTMITRTGDGCGDGWLRARRFGADDPERDAWQDAEQVLTSVGLCDGMVCVGAGCGDGCCAITACRRVGPRGRVCAVDIKAAAVAWLRERS